MGGETTMLPDDLPEDMPSFVARFGSDEQCREYLFKARWPDGFRCSACGHDDAYALRTKIVYECVACRKQHSLLAAHVGKPATVATDGWRGYLGLPAGGYDHEPINLGATRGAAALRLPGIHLVFSLVKRWLLGTHHGAVGEKHLQAYLDEYVFRFNRRTAERVSHGFARLIEHAVRIKPSTYRAIVAAPTPA